MTITKKLNENELVAEVSGRIDTLTAPEFEASMKENIENIKKIVIDFKAVEYISSAGLRVLLSLQKIMNKQGEMIIKNVNESVYEVFEVTGFSDILTIE